MFDRADLFSLVLSDSLNLWAIRLSSGLELKCEHNYITTYANRLNVKRNLLYLFSNRREINEVSIKQNKRNIIYF